MKKHRVTVAQNSVGQFHWKIEGHVFSPPIEKGVIFTQKKENMVQRVYDIYDSHK